MKDSDSLSSIFLKISSDKGNKYASEIRKTNLEGFKQYMDKVLEFISINLQAEANRVTSTTLGQLNTCEIGRNIKEIIEEHMDRAITFLYSEAKEDNDLNDFIPSLLKELAISISKDEELLNIVNDINEMNLYHDFGNIVTKIYSYDIKSMDKVFKYLVLVNIQRRIERRKFLNSNLNGFHT